MRRYVLMGGFFIKMLSENTMIEHFEHKSYEEQITLLESTIKLKNLLNHLQR